MGVYGVTLYQNSLANWEKYLYRKSQGEKSREIKVKKSFLIYNIHHKPFAYVIRFCFNSCCQYIAEYMQLYITLTSDNKCAFKIFVYIYVCVCVCVCMLLAVYLSNLLCILYE